LRRRAIWYYSDIVAEEYSIKLPSHINSTRVSLEPLIWQWFREIALEQGKPFGHLADEIDANYRLTFDRRGREQLLSLSSAIRTYVLEHIATGQHRNPRRSSTAKSPRTSAIRRSASPVLRSRP
jgi:predicted DNA-binding ribbon-helix-helix protein